MRANLDKAYANFTADERLSLLVEAAARRDRVESDRLWETAPIVRMQGVDPTLSQKWSELEAFASAIVIVLQGLLSAFHAAYSLHLKLDIMRDCYARGWLEAGGKAKALALREKKQEPDAEKVEEISAAALARAREAATFARVFDSACEEIGFSRETLVRAFLSPYHSEQLDIELPIVEHFAQGIDEQLRADMLAAVRRRHPALFEAA